MMRERAFLVGGTAVTAAAVFLIDELALLPFLTFPFVAWAAMRTGPAFTMAVLAVLGAIATTGTALGSGPFNALGQGAARAALELAAFMLTLTVVGLTVALVARHRREATRALAYERDLVAALLDSLADGVIACDADGRLTLLNKRAQTMHGVPAEALPPERWAESYDIYRPGTDDHPSKDEIPLYRALNGETVTGAEFDVAPEGLPRRTTSVSGQQVRSAEGDVLGAVVVMRDVTEERATQAALVEAEARWRKAFADSPVAMALVTLDMKLAEVNAAFCLLTGYDAAELTSMTFADITHPADVSLDVDLAERLFRGLIPSYEIEKRYITKNRNLVWVTLTASVVRDSEGAPMYGIGVMQDITERKRFAERLQHMADHDPLTGLCNRRRLHEELTRQVADSSRYGRHAALLLIDLDDFKSVNDTLGHKAGDEFLVGIAQRMTRRIRSSDFLARMGGDEFAVILPDTSVAEALAVANALRAAIFAERAPASELRTTASIGVTVHDDPAKTGEQLLVEADVALYAAKRAGRNQAFAYDPERMRAIGPIMRSYR